MMWALPSWSLGTADPDPRPGALRTPITSVASGQTLGQLVPET